MTRKKNIIMISMCAAILLMIIGYAAFASRLTIRGTSNITTLWQVEITNITSTPTGEAYNIDDPTFGGPTATFNAGFNKPGDKMTYTVTVKNTGDIPAIISDATVDVTGTPAIIYSIEDLQYGIRLGEGQSTTFKVISEFDINATEIPSDTSKRITINIVAIQDQGQSVTQGIPGLDQSTSLITTILNDNNPQADTGIDFSQPSSDTNGKGLYYTSTNTQGNKKTYYFRGEVTNNYVSFGTYKESYSYQNQNNGEIESFNVGEPIIWRIVRINEDGSVRLVKQDNIGYYKYNKDEDDNAYVGYMYGNPGSTTYADTHKNITNSNVKKELDNWYIKHLSHYFDLFEQSAGFCNDRSVFSGLGYGNNITYYGSYNRTNNFTPQFKCLNESNDLFTLTTSSKGNKSLTNPIGMLTIDEVLYAGDVWMNFPDKFYLNNGDSWITMSPYSQGNGSTNMWWVANGGYIDTSSSGGVRPVINIKGDLEVISGDGTSGNPYKVKAITKNTLVSNILNNNTAYADNVTSPYVTSSTGIDFSQPSSDTNGKGLYYTSANTQGDSTVYYFRGNVGNNYVKFGGEYGCVYNGQIVKNPVGRDILNSSGCSEVCTGTQYGTISGAGESYCESEGGTWTGKTASWQRVTNSITWRIIRINEDGTIRLIQDKVPLNQMSEFNASRDDNAYVGYMYGTPGSLNYEDTHKNVKNSTIKTYLDNWYTNNLNSYTKYIADSGFCNDRSLYSGLGYGTKDTIYSFTNRLNTGTPQFACPQKKDLFTVGNSGNRALKYSIGLITGDEFIYAGGSTSSNSSFYLFEDYDNWWTMTPSNVVDYSNDSDYDFNASTANFVIDYNVNSIHEYPVLVNGIVRPVINLKANVEITSGDGTKSNPYVIKVNK